MRVPIGSFGRVVQIRRSQLGLQQRDLAARANTDPSTISRWEKRNVAPRDRAALASLARALDISVEDLQAGVLPIDPLPRQEDATTMLIKALAHFAEKVDQEEFERTVRGLLAVRPEDLHYLSGLVQRFLRDRALNGDVEGGGTVDDADEPANDGEPPDGHTHTGGTD